MSGNSNPVITSSNATGSFTEDANTTGSTVDHVLTGTMNFTDSNRSDTHTTTSALKTASWSGGSTLPTGALAKFQAGLTSSIVSDSNGSGKLKWTFSEDDRDFDFLAKNETIVLTYEVTLKDNHGGSTKKTVTITVTGTDDKPVFATSAGATLSEQVNKTLSLSLDTANIALQFTDVDLNNTGHTASVLSVSASGNTSGILPGSLGTAELMSFFDIQNVVKNSGSSNGVVNTKFSAPDLAFDYLAAGEQIQITYVVQVDDKKGGLSTQNVVVTVNGTNDKPVVIGLPEARHLTEGEDLTAGNLTAAGDFVFSDIDLSDTHTVSTTVTATLSSGGTVPISEADLIAAMGAALADDPNSPGNPNDSTGDLFGKVVWSFALSDSDVNFLAEGEVLTLKYQIIVTDPSGASSSEEVCITIVGTADPILLTKTATVPGGTADTVGEVITYTITFGNNGSMPLTGVTVSDPSVSNLTFVGGDTDGDNQLDAGETWQYTATHTVTQDDIDTNGGGDGDISNTVTADSNETDPVSATASVAVDRRTSVNLVKTANVSSVDSAGDVINYTINVTNTGNATLFNPIVTDTDVTILTPILNFGAPVPGAGLLAPELNGDYNVGDTNENGFQDPGETFVFHNVGDTNQNDIEDPGETFEYTNIGDTNQNGFQDVGETFQFYNAGDTNQNGTEDPGETFQYDVTNLATPVDANNDSINDGDTDADGVFDPGETWRYTVNYTVTQDDIDNGGVVDAGLAHNNTAEVTTANGVGDTETVSVSIAQNPHVTLVKTASVPGGTADEGETIDYAISVTNDGNMTLSGVSVTDNFADNLTALDANNDSINDGDTDGDGLLDIGETWQYTADHMVTAAEAANGDATIDNTASVTTDQGASASDTASVQVTAIVDLDFSKAALGYHDLNNNDVADAGDVIDYQFTLHNGGNITLHTLGVSDTDSQVLVTGSPIDLAPGATDSMTWAASYTITATDVANGYKDNDATAVSDETSASSGTVHTVLAMLNELP